MWDEWKSDRRLQITAWEGGRRGVGGARFLRETNVSFRCIAVSSFRLNLIGLIILREALQTSKSPWWSLAVPDGEDLLRCESAHERNMINQMMGMRVCALCDCVQAGRQ